MNVKEQVVEYIENCEKNEPIFMEDIKKYVLMKTKKNKDTKQINNNINVIVHRMAKKNLLRTKYRGVYYKPRIMSFGETTISNKDLIEKKFLKDKEGNVNGYIVGAKLYNMIGLTTLVPNITDIVTNECKYHKVFYEKIRVNIYKPKIVINNENYLYLQLLDIMENKDNIVIEENNLEKVIFKIMENNKLEFEKLIKYARITGNKKAIKTLINIAR